MKKPTALLALLLAGVLTLAACGSDDTSNTSGDTSTAKFNDADVQFAQEMIPHHQQAVEMSRMAASQADSPEVKKLAADIEAAQGPEIDTMTQWLQDWGMDVPSSSASDMGGMDMGDGGHMGDGEMPGMMSDEDLHRLGQADGAGWDRMFLTMMISHHEGAVEMAQAEQTDGQNPDAVALAKTIERAQTAEIATMKDMLAS